MLKSFLRQHLVSKYPNIKFDVLTPPDLDLGDYSTNIAFAIGKEEKRSPIDVGTELVEAFKSDPEISKYFDRIEFVKPGFINFYFSHQYLIESLKGIIEKGSNFGSLDKKEGNINVEFISANPTGPVTVGNARAGSYGDALTNILKKAGYTASKEYYINDAGNQVRKLGISVALRIKEIKGETIEFTEDLYQGGYVKEIAQEILDTEDVPDMNVDELGAWCQPIAISKMVEKAKLATKSLGVNFDAWFSENSLHDSGEISKALSDLKEKGYTYESEGATWLKVTEIMGDDSVNDAVLVKTGGSTSYLMNDIAYTRNKIERGFTRLINIWGADHHGDVIRILAGAKALGYEGKLEVLLNQLVLIKKKDEYQRMSKRKGEFILLDEFISEVGKDAIRFFFLLKDLNTHMDFDVDLAKEQSKQNPVFYIQYATARLNSIFTKANSIEGSFDGIKEAGEIDLIRSLIRMPDIIDDISGSYQVHHLAQYAYDVSAIFHKFYENHQIIDEKNPEVTSSRISIAKATNIVIRESLAILGIDSRDRM